MLITGSKTGLCVEQLLIFGSSLFVCRLIVHSDRPKLSEFNKHFLSLRVIYYHCISDKCRHGKLF